MSSLTVLLDSGNDPFTIVNENTGKCIKPLNDWIVATDCDTTKDMLWKWVSQHRLFHLQTQQCLGLDITKPVDSLRMFSCNASAMLWWKCEHHSLYGAAQSRLALHAGHAIASANASDVWKKGGSGGSLCDQPYHGECRRLDSFAVVFGTCAMKHAQLATSGTGEGQGAGLQFQAVGSNSEPCPWGWCHLLRGRRG